MTGAEQGGEDGAVTTAETPRRAKPVLHDPPRLDNGGWGDTCTLCDEPFPCAERKRQRREKHQIDRLLDSALYKPTSPRTEIDGYPAIHWQSPLEWSVDLTYGEKGLIVVVHSFDGDHRSDDATVEWLDSVLA